MLSVFILQRVAAQPARIGQLIDQWRRTTVPLVLSDPSSQLLSQIQQIINKLPHSVLNPAHDPF